MLQFIGLVSIGDPESVQIAAAADLELCDVSALLDFHSFCILAACREQELLDFSDLLGLQSSTSKRKIKGRERLQVCAREK